MTVQDYQEMLASQGGCCAICKRPEDKIHHASGTVQRLAVDHDHTCCPTLPACGSCNRGLLCAWCNTLLGKIEARGIDLSAVASYLADGL